jgi:hypothetical protein
MRWKECCDWAAVQVLEPDALIDPLRYSVAWLDGENYTVIGRETSAQPPNKRLADAPTSVFGQDLDLSYVVGIKPRKVSRGFAWL